MSEEWRWYAPVTVLLKTVFICVHETQRQRGKDRQIHTHAEVPVEATGECWLPCSKTYRWLC